MFNKVHKAIFYTLLLAVYTVFFSVQSFFNFDGISDTHSIFRIDSPAASGRQAGAFTVASRTVASLASVSLYGTHVLNSHPAPTSSHKVRLNKRFQQEDMPPCDVISVVVPEQYVPLRTPDYHRTIYLPSVVLLHRPLRGPPVVA